MDGYIVMSLAIALLVLGIGLLINELLHLRAGVQPDWQMFLLITVGLGCLIGGALGLVISLLI